MNEESRRRMVSSLVRRSIGPRRAEGVNALLRELSSRLMLTEDVTTAFHEACTRIGMVGDPSVLLANRMTVTTILNESCRTAGLPEPHIDAASVPLMKLEEL